MTSIAVQLCNINKCTVLCCCCFVYFLNEKETFCSELQRNVTRDLCVTDPRLCLRENDATVWPCSNKALLKLAANVLVLPVGPKLKLRHLSKLASINFGRQLPLSSPKTMQTARHSISSACNGNMMLDMNEDVDIFTENTVAYVMEQNHEEEDFNFLFNSTNLIPLTINSQRPLTPLYYSKKWRDKREERGTAMLKYISGCHSGSLTHENCGSFTWPANPTFLKTIQKHRYKHA